MTCASLVPSRGVDVEERVVEGLPAEGDVWELVAEDGFIPDVIGASTASPTVAGAELAASVPTSRSSIAIAFRPAAVNFSA